MKCVHRSSSSIIYSWNSPSIVSQCVISYNIFFFFIFLLSKFMFAFLNSFLNDGKPERKCVDGNEMCRNNNKIRRNEWKWWNRTSGSCNTNFSLPRPTFGVGAWQTSVHCPEKFLGWRTGGKKIPIVQKHLALIVWYGKACRDEGESSWAGWSMRDSIALLRW